MPAVRTLLAQTLKTPARRFQVAGVRFLVETNGRAILGDSMGVGKTIQAIGYTAIKPDQRPVLVVCPASVKYHWQREFDRHAGLKSVVLDGQKPYAPPGDIWIINYDILRFWTEEFLNGHKPVVLILDELHRAKSRKAIRTKCCSSIAKIVPHVIALSGTPITNRPVEFFPVLNMVAPKDFPNFFGYAFRYCGPRRGWGGSWDFNGASNLGELHARLKPLMLRRTKAEVLPELPAKTRTIIPVDIDNGIEYRRARDEFIAWLAEAKGAEAAKRARGAEAIVRLGHLKQLAAKGKFAGFCRWVEEWLEERPGEKLVLFCVHRLFRAALCHRFGDTAVGFDGSVDPKDRQTAIDAFQQTPAIRVFVCSKAGWEGTTLTAGATTAFLELGWTPTEHEQAEDRVLRIGQTASKVEVFYFVARNTIDEYIWELIESKREIVGQVVDGDKARHVQTFIIDYLLKEVKPK